MKNGKLGIAIDLDDSTLDFMTPYLEFFNQLYGTTHRHEDIFSFDLGEVFGMPGFESQRRMAEFCNGGGLRKLKPIPGIQQAIETLVPNNHLEVVTARDFTVLEDTLGLIHLHFPNKFQWVNFAHTYVASHRRSKLEICKERGLSVIRDDSLRTCIECYEGGMQVIVVDKPWNRVPLPDGMYREHSPEELPWIVDEIRRKIF